MLNQISIFSDYASKALDCGKCDNNNHDSVMGKLLFKRGMLESDELLAKYNECMYFGETYQAGVYKRLYDISYYFAFVWIAVSIGTYYPTRKLVERYF